MVPSFCGNCLSQVRPVTARTAGLSSLIVPTSSSAPRSSLSKSSSAWFHTSAVRAFPMPPKKSVSQQGPPKYREAKSARMKKKKQIDRPRPPAVGERKALRKRIVLSNPNALEIPDMPELSAETMVDVRLRGSVVGLPVSMLDQLRAVEAFKPKQGWSIFHRPGTVVRKETLELARLFERVESDGVDKGKVFRRIVTGVRGSGKSVHLLQATAMAFTKSWVVIAVPEPQDLVNAHKGYAPIPDTDPVLYAQNEATAGLLSRTLKANEDILSKLHVCRRHPALKAGVSAGMTLRDLANLGIQDPAIAWTVFQALWAELTAAEATLDNSKFTARPPILVTVDGLAHWMQDSAYRSAEYEPIHAHDLVFVKHFLSLLQPPRPTANSNNNNTTTTTTTTPIFPSGGLVLYATSASNSPSVYSFDLALKQAAARQAGISPTSAEFPSPESYAGVDPRVLEVFGLSVQLESPASTTSTATPAATTTTTTLTTTKTTSREGTLEIQTLHGLERDETRGYMEYFARSGLLRERISEEWVGEKWTLAGGGLIGELEKLGRRFRVAA